MTLLDSVSVDTAVRVKVGFRDSTEMLHQMWKMQGSQPGV